jgi:hypothetical protein
MSLVREKKIFKAREPSKNNAVMKSKGFEYTSSVLQ